MYDSAYLIKINYFLPALLHSLPLSPTSRYSLVVAIDKFRGSHPRKEIEYGMALSLPSSKLQLCPPSHPSLSFSHSHLSSPFPSLVLIFFTVVVEIRGSWASVKIGSVAIPDDKVSYTPFSHSRISYSLPPISSLSYTTHSSYYRCETGC